MDNHFNTPAEVIDLSIKACENKTRLPLGKMILLGIMAGAFIAFGGATSSTAAHAVENVGVARALAGCIFPVGLMLIVFLGGELFTGNCLIIMDVFNKRVTWGGLFRDLFIVFFSNLLIQSKLLLERSQFHHCRESLPESYVTSWYVLQY